MLWGWTTGGGGGGITKGINRRETHCKAEVSKIVCILQARRIQGFQSNFQKLAANRMYPPSSTWSDMFPVLVIASPSLRGPEGEFEDCIFSSSIRVYSKPDARMEMVQRPVHYYYYYVVGDTSSQHSLQGLPVSQNPR